MLQDDDSPPTPPLYPTPKKEKMEFELDWQETLDMFPRPPDYLPLGFNDSLLTEFKIDYSPPNTSADLNPEVHTTHPEDMLEEYCPYGTPNSGRFYYSPISPLSPIPYEDSANVVSSPEEPSLVTPERTKEKGKARASIDIPEDEADVPSHTETDDEESSSALTRDEKQKQAKEDAAMALKFAMTELMELGLSEEEAFQQVCRNESNLLSGDVAVVPSTPTTKQSTREGTSQSVPVPVSHHSSFHSRSNSTSTHRDPLLARFEDAYETHVISKHVPNVSSPFLSTGWLPPAHGPEYVAKPSTSSAGSPLSSSSICARRMTISSTSLTRESSFDSSGSSRQSSLVNCASQKPGMLLEESLFKEEENDELIRNIQHKLDEIYEDNRRALIRDIDQIAMANTEKYYRSRSKSWNVGPHDGLFDRYGQYNHYHHSTLTRIPRFALPPTPGSKSSASRSFTSNTMKHATMLSNQVAGSRMRTETSMQKPVLGSAWGSLLETVSHRVGWPSGHSKEPIIPEFYPEETERQSQ